LLSLLKRFQALQAQVRQVLVPPYKFPGLFKFLMESQAKFLQTLLKEFMSFMLIIRISQFQALAT
jgi:hypothetical protein